MDANYAVKKVEFNKYVKSVKNDNRIAKPITIFICLTYTKIISNKPGIQFL